MGRLGGGVRVEEGGGQRRKGGRVVRVWLKGSSVRTGKSQKLGDE